MAEAPHIVFVAPPFAGHLYPQIPLALAAQAAGYRVTMITGDAKIATLRQAGLTADGLACLAPGALEAISDTKAKVGANPLRLLGQLRDAFALMELAKVELADRWRQEKPDLVVADFISVAAGLAAEEVGAPWITTLSAGFNLITGAGTPAYVGGWTPGLGAIGRLRDTAGRGAVQAGRQALALAMRAPMKRLGLSLTRPDGSEGLYSPTAILAMDMAELEFPNRWPKTVRFIGPVFDNPEPSAPLQLADGAPRVLITIGTHLPWAKKSLVEEARRLARLAPEVQLVASLGEPENLAPTPVIDEPGLQVFAYVPYRDELPRFEAVIHHGGAGVTGATIAAARPALVVPHDYDQFDYAARVEHHGLGLRARRIGSADAAAKLRRLLVEPRPAVAAFAGHAAAYAPRDAFLEVVGGIVGRARRENAA